MTLRDQIGYVLSDGEAKSLRNPQPCMKWVWCTLTALSILRHIPKESERKLRKVIIHE